MINPTVCEAASGGMRGRDSHARPQQGAENWRSSFGHDGSVLHMRGGRAILILCHIEDRSGVCVVRVGWMMVSGAE